MWPERVNDVLKSETVQHVFWSYLHAFSFDEIHNETEENTPSKSMDNEQSRKQMKETKQEYKYFSYRHKKFGNIAYGTIGKDER
jgi:hypothetical protein